jgi:hypothetical protein
MLNEEKTSILYFFVLLLSPAVLCNSPFTEISKTDLKIWAFISGHKLTLSVKNGQTIPVTGHGGP